MSAATAECNVRAAVCQQEWGGKRTVWGNFEREQEMGSSVAEYDVRAAGMPTRNGDWRAVCRDDVMQKERNTAW